ncbi:hypothetical protein [Vibrio phage RYC]|nr:hypothetical protein [Vibrio phage RYC]
MSTVCHKHHGFIQHSYIKAKCGDSALEQATQTFNNVISVIPWSK